MTLVNCDYCGGTGVCSDEEYEPADCDMCEGSGCVQKAIDVLGVPVRLCLHQNEEACTNE